MAYEAAAASWESPVPEWRDIARPEQLPPDSQWLVWAFIAGRGAGKTRSAAEWTHERAMANPKCRIALVGRTPADVRDVMIEGESGLLAVARGDRPVYQPTKRRMTWPNGSMAYTYSAEVPSQLRGPQHHFAWCFPAGTLIRTPRGQRPIEALRVGDLVMTRNGARRVLRTGSRFAELAKVRHGDGRSLTGTLDHPVWTVERGWTELRRLAAGDTLFTWSDDGSATSAATSTGTSAGARSGATGKSGNKPTAPSRPEARSTTSTTSPATTGPATSSSSPLPPTGSTMPKTARSASAVTAARTSSTPPAAVLPGTASLARSKSLKRAGFSPSTSASSAGASSRPVRGSASVVSGVSTSGLAGRVYNLTVEGEHEYFADDVLVHNCDEPAAWTDARKGDVLDTAWNNLMLGLRLGSDPRCVFTTTPKPNALIRTVLGRDSTAVTRGSTYDNLDNLAGSFREQVLAAYEGTRIGRQELLGELLEDVEGALWTIALIDDDRVKSHPDLSRIVVAVDPSGGSGPNNDEQGIVVAGLGVDAEVYVLADRSCRLSPHGWASRAIAAYREFDADRIVAEVNFGGEMVASTIGQVDPAVPVKVISASRGKVQRAEPVAAAYEKHRVHHVGPLAQLEDQMTTWTPQDGTSPDRLDALVWAVTELTGNFGADAWLQWARKKAEEAARARGELPPEPLAPEPEASPAPEPEPMLSPAELRRQARNEALRAQRDNWR